MAGHSGIHFTNSKSKTKNKQMNELFGVAWPVEKMNESSPISQKQLAISHHLQNSISKMEVEEARGGSRTEIFVNLWPNDNILRKPTTGENH